MPVQITIRGVAEEVRDELALRAAARRQSMQEFLRCELERIASRPSVDLWLRDVRRRKAATGTTVPRSAILRGPGRRPQVSARLPQSMRPWSSQH